MTEMVFRSQRRSFVQMVCGALALLALATALPAAQSPKLPIVAKWGRFEHTFRSSVNYPNALQDATLTVLVTSPLGETNRVYGFWDGGRTWRVRFSPNQPGRWSFTTICSDASNRGLHQQSGEFVCTAITGQSRFNQHGPVRVARERRHLEHADGTPFFWLADTVWDGARLSTPKDWQIYAQTRASQKFTAAQWSVAPGEDVKTQPAFTGREHVAVNPEFFKRLDAKIDTLNRAGLLSVITPLWEINLPAAEALPEDQVALLLRYMLARWDADDVAWLISFEGGSVAKNISRWKRIGRAVYGDTAHSPVILFPGETHWVLEEFRNESWVDVFAYQSGQDISDATLKWTLSGPLPAEWRKEPARPIINVAPPYENHAIKPDGRRITADDVRRAIWWSLLMSPTVGVSYGAEDVINWNTSVESKQTGGSGLPAWQQALTLPGVKHLELASTFFNSIEFWRLRPEPRFVVKQPGNVSPRRHIAAAGTTAKDLSLVYVPEDRTIEILTEALPASPTIGWMNPRSGTNSPAVAVVGGNSCQFPTPDPGDWVLVMKAGAPAEKK